MLLPELMAGDHKIIGFGRGLGLAAENPRDMWQSMIAQVAMTKNLSVALLAGFLIGLQTRDRALADALLDEAVEDLTLAEWFPVLQAFIDIDEMGLARLHRALALGKAPMNAYYNLACGRSCDAVPGPEFKHLVLAIDAKPGGNSVAMKILFMRIHSDRTDNKHSVQEVAEVGRALLSAFEFQKGNRSPWITN